MREARRCILVAGRRRAPSSPGGRLGGHHVAREHRRLAAIVSADVTGYSLLMGRDDSGTLAALKAHRRELIDPKIAEYGGRIVKTTGDGLLLEFPSVVEAVRCAVDVQRGMAERNAAVPPDERIAFRIGINVGDIIIDDDDIFGDGVNVAARLETLADPGGICVSRAVRDQVLDKLSFAFDDLGAQEVKNIVRPVEVYRVALEAQAPPARGRRRWWALGAGPRAAGRQRWAWRAAAIVIPLLMVGGWAAWRHVAAPAYPAAYSLQDRRMTFAVLPLASPPGDEAAARMAATVSDAMQRSQEARVRWANVVPRSRVELVARDAAVSELARALDVHFLLRGTIVPAPPGYNAELLVVDAQNEQAIEQRTVAIPAGTSGADAFHTVNAALGYLTYKALEVEVRHARQKPDAALDERDLAFRAYIDWGERKRQRDEKGAYTTASQLLNRAAAIAPNDPLVLDLTAQVNLCDCVEAWSTNVEEQQALGSAALEKSLRRDPRSPSMLSLKADLYALRGRFEESALIADDVLKADPLFADALVVKAYDELKLARPAAAIALLDQVREAERDENVTSIAASAHYALAQYEPAADLARKATLALDRDERRNRRAGAVALTLVAAEARLGHGDRARRALADFAEAVPNVTTASAIRQWMHPSANLAHFEPLYDGLRLAGVPD